jgi:hypothetical protein
VHCTSARDTPSGPKSQKKAQRRHICGGQKSKGKGRAAAYIATEDSDGDFVARAVEEEPESELARKEISKRGRKRALEIATRLGVQDDSHRLGQLARVVADSHWAQWEKTCEEQDTLMARRAAHNPYVEHAVSAVIPLVLSEPARITSERKRADEMRPLLEMIQATGGLPRSGVMGNHCNMRDSDNIVKDVHGPPKLLMPAPKRLVIPALMARIDSEPEPDYDLKATPMPAPAPPAPSPPRALTPPLATSTLPPSLAVTLTKLPWLAVSAKKRGANGFN